MSEELNELPSEKDDLNEIFDALMEIGEVIENAHPLNKNHSIICPHCGKTFFVENGYPSEWKPRSKPQG